MLEKTLKLYKAASNSPTATITRFPVVAEGELPLLITDFSYDAKRMGGAPTIQCTVMYQRCLDDEWTDYVYTEFRGERYYLKQTPSSTKDSKDARWKHECVFVSERVVLDNVYFFDMVDESSDDKKPVSSSTEFTFFGTIDEFAKRLNQSLLFAGLDYSVNVEKHRDKLKDAAIGKQVSFEDKFISEALQEIFNVYGYHYYFEGKTIYVGDSEESNIGSEENPLEYGVTKELLSIQKNNANYKPINKICGRGSDQNIPYYYPNPTRKGEVEFEEKDTNDSWSYNIVNQPKFSFNIADWSELIRYKKINKRGTIGLNKVYSNTGSIESPPDWSYSGVEDFSSPFWQEWYEGKTTLDIFNTNAETYINVVSGNYYDGFLFVSDKFRFQEPLNRVGEQIKISLYIDDLMEYTYVEEGESAFREGNSTFNTSIQYEIFEFQEDGSVSKVNNVESNDNYCVLPISAIHADKEYYLRAKVTLSNINFYPAGALNPRLIYYAGININSYLNIENYIAKGYIEVRSSSVLKERIFSDDSDVYPNNTQPLLFSGIEIDHINMMEDGDFLKNKTKYYWKPQKNLQTNVYIESESEKRFYPALEYPRDYEVGDVINEEIGEEIIDGKVENDNYKDDNNNYYDFENPYNGTNPYEHIIDFEDIMPTIEGMINGQNQRIDMFSEFAYDFQDNNFEKEYKKDDGEDSGQLKREHPYFFGKLRKMDFNLFDHAIEGGEMTIAMTSGVCGSCKFVIHVGKETQKNFVQVNADGTLMRDEYGNVLCNREIYVDGSWKSQDSQEPQDEQNDTINNEVWVALAKDVETFPSVMPYAQDGVLSAYRPTADEGNNGWGDTFVILNIHLPQAYIDAAQDRLTKETIKYLADSNKEKFTFSIDFSRVYLAHNQGILDRLSENSKVFVKYNNKVYPQYISSYSYKMSSKDALPEIKVELSETLSTQQGALQQVINAVKADVQYTIGRSSGVSLGDLDRQYIRRDIQDTTAGNITFLAGTKYGKVNAADGTISAQMEISETNESTLTVDNLIVRKDYNILDLEQRLLSLEQQINQLTNN